MVRNYYPEEFKADAVALYLSDPSKTHVQVAEDLGVSRGTLRQWVLEAQRSGTAGPKPSAAHKPVLRGNLSSDDVLEEENQQLKARVWELELERDILRKAAKFFAGETKW